MPSDDRPEAMRELVADLVAAVAWLQSGGRLRSAAGMAALGTICGPVILAGAIKDWVR